jgi:hypothetical protein
VPPGAREFDLSHVLLAEELAQVRREGWSGVLALSQGEVTKGLYFVDGEIAFAASTVEEDRIGAHLSRLGKITEAQFRAAMRASEGPGQRIGQALLEAGVLRPDDLSEALYGQVERIVLSVLRWTSGRGRREPMDRPIPADLAVHIETHGVLLAGMRAFPDVARLERELGEASRRLRRVSLPPFDVERLPPTPVERAVLQACLRSAPLDDLFGLPHPRRELVRALYGLKVAGLLEEVTPAERTPPPPPTLQEPLASASLPAPVVLTAAEAERSARALLDRGQRPRAVEVLEEALEREPEARGLRRMLALTLGREPFRKEVEEHFLKALEAEAADNELRYALAGYYRKAGMSARAILQLRLVLSADSSHAAAWRDLGELEAGAGRRRP